MSAEKLDALNRRLKEACSNDAGKTAKERTPSEKRKRLVEKEKSKNRKVQDPLSSTEPSRDQINHLLERYQAADWKKLKHSPHH